MTCGVCGSERIAAVALPEEGPTALRVCLACGHLWSAGVLQR